MKVGVLTGGGDCPGLNAVIRAVVRKAEREFGDTVVGFLDGWRGLLDDRSMPLDVAACRGILPRGGTIIGTSRYQPYMFDDGVDRVKATLARHETGGVDRDWGRRDPFPQHVVFMATVCRWSACRRPSTTTSAGRR